MRRIIIAAALIAAAGGAQASSIEVFSQSDSAKSSIIKFGCSSCVKAKVAEAEAQVSPEMAPGSQSVELRVVDGKNMIYRTDNWLGGSAVTWVSKGTPLELQAYGFEPDASAVVASEGPADNIDRAQPAARLAQSATPAVTIAEAPASSAPVDTAPNSAARMIDRSATTSAITADTSGMAAAARPFDASKLELRLN